MAKQYTGIDGTLYCDGASVAKVRSWSLQATADTLETTSLGDFAKSYVYGTQGAGGSITALFYEDDANRITATPLLGDVLRTTATATDLNHTLELRLGNGSRVRAIGFKALLNNVSIDMQYGDIVTAEISYTVTGPLALVTI